MLTNHSLIQQDHPEWHRYEMTVSCRNCDYIPKVPNAGEIITENGQTYQVMHNGVKVLKGGYLGDWMAQTIATLRGHHEPQEEKVFFELLKYVPAHSTMLELGAWWAYYSLWFQKAIPGAVNFLVEPDPGYLAIGKANFALNRMQATFIDAAVGAVSTDGVSFPVESTRSTRMVEQVSVDDLLVRLGIDRVEVLHADIQGAELDMLRGCAQSLAAGKIRFLVLSTHHHLISHDPIIHHRCLELLKQYDAHIIAQHTVSESFSGDGLIVASFDPADRVLPQILISKNIPSNSLFREVEFDLADLQAEYQRLLDAYNQNASSHAQGKFQEPQAASQAVTSDLMFLDFEYESHPYTLAVRDEPVLGARHDAIIQALIQGSSVIVPAMSLLLKLAFPNAHVLDIGAHVGTFAVPMAALGASVAAVEGSSKNVAMLNASKARNRLENLQIVHAVATDYVGTAVFASRGPWGEVVPANTVYLKEANDISSVSTLTLDRLVETLQWDHVDFLKIDVEGSEPAVFKGMTGLLGREDAPVISFEGNNYILRMAGTKAEDLLTYLRSFGFDCYVCESSKLYAVTPDYAQVSPVTDYIAAKPSARLPELATKAGWSVEPGLDPDTIYAMVQPILPQCRIDVTFRQVTLQGLEEQPEFIRQSAQVQAAIRQLKDLP